MLTAKQLREIEWRAGSYRTGEIVPESGAYEIWSPRSRLRGERQLKAGKPFPPTPAKGQHYRIKAGQP